MATGSSISTTGEGPVSREASNREQQRPLCIPQGNTQRCGPLDPMPLRAMCTHTVEPRSRALSTAGPRTRNGGSNVL